MKIAFRADASITIGSGHVMRCLALGEYLRKNGVTVCFVCRELPGNLCDYIEQGRGFPLTRLPMAATPAKRPETISGGNNASTAWPGTDWKADFEQTLEAMRQFDVPFDWLAMDHYALDTKWEAAMRSATRRIMVIDDLADRHHDCDLLLDQNFYEDLETRYEGLVPTNCRKLLGPKYALLRPEFRDARKKLRKRDGSIRRILIFFGEGDPTNETAKALSAICLLQRPDIAVDVVVGRSNPHKEKIKELCIALPKSIYHCQVSNIAKLMAKADLAIGAVGTATWERAALGLPALVVVIADNQERIAQHLADIGVLHNLGKSSNVSVENVLQLLKKMMKDKDGLARMAGKAGLLVDGLGVDRVVETLLNTS